MRDRRGIIAALVAVHTAAVTADTVSRPIDGKHFLGFNVNNLQSGNFSQDAAYTNVGVFKRTNVLFSSNIHHYTTQCPRAYTRSIIDRRTQTTAHVLKAGTLRYPGGNLADWWDWRTGWCVPETTTSGCEALKNPCASKQHRKVYKVREVWWQLYILLDVCIRTLYTHVAIQPPPIPIEI